MAIKRKYTFWQRLIAALCNQHPGVRFRDESKPHIPLGSYDIEVFAIKPNPEGQTGKQAFIGYKLPNDDFEYIQVPYTEEQENENK